ncbi:MAG TPA: response regulator [Xanthomonadaceae bacterium]|nr:response regulator [Xanthomonadaceae bacterium]
MSRLEFFRRMLQRAPHTTQEPAPDTAPADRRGAVRVNAREGLRVLIIDDSATIIAVLGKMLRQNGYEVLAAADAETGIERARAERPDLVYLDIVLPGMNGFDALRALRRDPATKSTPVIMISGNAQATEQFYVRRIGADDFMKKPFGRGEVFARIQQLVESGRLPARAAPAPELLSDDGSVAPADGDAADADSVAQDAADAPTAA